MQLSARILTALAVLTLAVAYVAGSVSTPAVNAATGTIDVINVGTCYSTDTDVLDEGDCDDGDTAEGYSVAGRTGAEEADTVYATYSVDPKTSADAPRGILYNSDLIKVSIHDPDRDKRTPVLLGFAGATVPITETNARVISEDQEVDDLSELGASVNSDGTVDIDTDIASQYFVLGGSDNMDTAANAQVDKSGNSTFRIHKPSTATHETYKPIAEDAAITFYGMIEGESTLQNLEEFIERDEDSNSGVSVSDYQGLERAPWLTLQVSPTAGKYIQFMYAVYHTSEIEALIGGVNETGYASETMDDQNNPGTPIPVNPPGFTNDEEDGDELLLRVEGDGVDSSQNLWLLETSRFSSRYEGYVRLTDANGRISGTDPNWGIETRDADSYELDDAAVIGVESGPVTIRYRDSDGTTRTLSIQIDTLPPAIQVDIPTHKEPTSDSSPEFAGTFTDDVGLREDSFQLYIDNTNDAAETGDNDGGTYAVNLRVDRTLSTYSGTPDVGDVHVLSTDDPVELRSNYKGYKDDDDSQFGVIKAVDIYKTSADLGDGKQTQSATPDDYNDGATEGGFQDSATIDFEGQGEPDGGWNNTIDFQAFVIDLAGNIGFSDSDAEGPTFINDLGTERSDRKTGRYNVLGWYARHVLVLDEVDPELDNERSVTGFYDEEDDALLINRSGIMLVFDGAIDPESVGIDTFEVTLDEDESGNAAQAAVVDIVANGNLVFLLLDQELASDATPTVGLARGKTVEDLAQNVTRSSDAGGKPIEINDGISPVISVSLSDGSGSGEGNEGPSALTKDTITVFISSDEVVQSAPLLSVVCSDVAWSDTDGDYDLDDFVGNRDGASSNQSADSFKPIAGSERVENCGDEEGDTKVIHYVQAYARQGNTWEYQWRNISGDDQELADGNLTVVAFARDKSSYVTHDHETNKLYNWAASTSEFRLDTIIEDPTRDDNDGSVQPTDGANISEARPFVLIEFDDPSTVSIDTLSVDDADQDAQSLGANRFLYWPDTLATGDHEVSVKAIDAAGNEGEFDWKFKVQEPTSFVIELLAGWNAVSVPANPIDPTLDSVFSNNGIDQVIGWDGTDAVSPWRIATKIDGAWSTSDEFASLTGIEARYGYWVHSLGFLDQEVLLVGQPRRGEGGNAPPDPIDIQTNGGWNFVGVVDQDGDQTQKDDFGTSLEYRGLNGSSDVVDASGYLGDYVRAYTWDPIRSRFDDLESDEEVEVGSGIWVYFANDFDIAP